ncbi:hypothetical protein [Hoeflea sp. TYP-13]|uniref:hypothetical protein n=1 Tax=Hoeflea sp. TYP-13 TaxID=3230023 RepID=UPI0034C67E2F
MARNENEVREIIGNTAVELIELAKEIDDQFLLHLISMVMIAANKQAMIEIDKADGEDLLILH